MTRDSAKLRGLVNFLKGVKLQRVLMLPTSIVQQPFQCLNINIFKKFTTPLIVTNQHSLELSGRTA